MGGVNSWKNILGTANYNYNFFVLFQDAIDNDNGVVVANDSFSLLFLFDSGFPSF